MAVASKSASVHKRRVPSRARTIAASHPVVRPLAVKARTNNADTDGYIPMPTQSAPFWLRRLCILQRQSTVITFLLVTTTLALYGWTVYCQQLWSQAYHKLVTLQRDERQLTTTSEVLKNQIALQAEQPTTRLVPANPARAIFLQPAPQIPVPTTQSGLLDIKPADRKQLTSTPLGY